jgi:hypothetical protein
MGWRSGGSHLAPEYVRDEHRASLVGHHGLPRFRYVLDSVSQSCDVVLVRRAFSSGKPQGVGILEWGGDGNGEISLPATWDQGGRDPITARRVPSK